MDSQLVDFFLAQPPMANPIPRIINPADLMVVFIS
jgi:hypothetical protein